MMLSEKSATCRDHALKLILMASSPGQFGDPEQEGTEHHDRDGRGRTRPRYHEERPKLNAVLLVSGALPRPDRAFAAGHPHPGGGAGDPGPVSAIQVPGERRGRDLDRRRDQRGGYGGAG